MKTLTHKDFVTEFAGDIPYQSHRGDGFEVTVEPCLSGYDVTLYDSTQNIVGEKFCTEEDFVPLALLSALEMANKKVADFLAEQP